MKLFLAVYFLIFCGISKLSAMEIEHLMPISTIITPTADSHSSFATSSNITNDLFDYHVCGNVTKLTDCTCENDAIECKPTPKTGYTYWFDLYNPPFTSTNIQILNQNFIPKNVTFKNNEITKLQKDKVLPRIESNVEKLELVNNRIKEIENGTFDKFTSLKNLDLTFNFLSNITAEVLTKQLGSTLKTLNISDNGFHCLSSIDLSNMVKLEELDISRNGYIASHGNFSKYIFPKSLSNLKILDLSYNMMSKLNDDIFVNLLNLEILKLDGNPITSFPKSFNILTNLRHLYLDNADISVLNESLLHTFTKLETFNMMYSSLTKIDDCTFCNKPNLKSVMLYENPSLSYIHENAFGNIYNGTSEFSLESFSIESCNLSIIPENLLNWITVKEFGLGNNPFICNCSMAWLINDILTPTHSSNMKSFLPSQNVHYSRSEENGFKCYGPIALKNVPFSHISQKICPVEAKKEIVYVKENISLVTVLIFIAACFFTFILGIFVAPFARQLLRSKIQENGIINKNFEDERNVEDFDVDYKSFY